MLDDYSFWELAGAAVFAALAIKSLLFWVYLWQFKEYRLDRFRAEYGSARWLLRFWFFVGGRRLVAPTFTMRSAAVALAAFALLGVFGWWLVFQKGISAFPAAVILYLAVPAAVAACVAISWIPVAAAKRTLLARLARKRAAMPRLIVIGITGSFGKSSTKEFIAAILGRRFKVVKTPANINTEIGIARFVLSPSFDRGADVFVAEVGAYREDEIKRVARALTPAIAVITGISEQHLALFGSLARTMAAKYELVEALPEDGLALFNGENEHARKMSERWHGKKMLYRALPEAAEARLAPFYRVNVSAAVLIARHLGMSEDEIKKAVRDLKPIGNMLRMHHHPSGALIIDDEYSANPDGVFAALKYLNETGARRRIAVMPCLIELGDRASDIHRRIGRAIAEADADAFITTADYFNDIRASAGERARLVADPARIVEELRQYLAADCAILLEGRIPGSIVKSLLP